MVQALSWCPSWHTSTWPTLTVLPACRSQRPSLVAAEEKMAQYHRAGEDAWAAGCDCDVLFIRIR